VIAVGIDGSGAAEAEFSKARPTGFLGTILLNPRQHGYDTCVAMYRWITQGIAPAPLTYTAGKLMTRDNWQALKAEQAA
jgi:ABC-type sugar transport system substrate-binding protein